MPTPSCYNATRTFANGWSPGNGDTLSVQCRKVDFDTGTPGSFQCKNGVWEQEAAPPACLAVHSSAWRLKNAEDLPHGWLLHELKFYSDNECKKHIDAGGILQSFTEGPAVIVQSPKQALDGDRMSIWKAPCADPVEADLCGCMSTMNEGYSVSAQKCVPGEITSGYAEEICVKAGVKKQSTNQHVIGCPKGSVTIGIELKTPQQIGCVGILQDGQKKRNHQQLDNKLKKATSSLVLERWNGRGWEEVRRWTNLNAEGYFDYLPLQDRCPQYQLPENAPSWVEVLGTASGHGAKRTIRCADGEPKQVQVECIDGVWSTMPGLLCEVPAVPVGPPPRPTQPPQDSASQTGESMALSIFLLGLMAVVLICFLYIAREVAKCYGERKRNIAMYASPDKDLEMPATTLMNPQCVGRSSGQKPASARERRHRELGALSSSEFKVKAAQLRAQVAECLDNCSPKVVKKSSLYRQGIDSTPVKMGIDKKGDRHSSPGDVSFGHRKKDIGMSPPLPPTPPESLPERRRKKTHRDQEQHKTSSSSPTRHHRQDESRTDRSSSSPTRRHRSDESRIDITPEASPNNLADRLPPPPPPVPPPGRSNTARKLPAIPSTRSGGGMSRDGADVMLNF